jgi:tetratricopeptide (TPR) repeat protein
LESGMKALVFMLPLAALGMSPGLGQTAVVTPPAVAAPAVAAPAPTPEQIAAFQQRFEQGYALEKAGKLEEARTVYDGILADQPEAKRSLLEAGRVSLDLNQPARAEAYLEKLHAIVPDFPTAYELLIQASQALRQDVKAERLVREYRALRDSGRVPGFDQALFFEREHLRLGQGAEIVFSQFFDFTQPPFYVLKAEEFGPGHVRQHVLLLKYDPDATQALRAKDPQQAQATVFILAEPFFANGRMVRIDVYQEIFTVPEYRRARNTMLGILAHPPKPIYSAPVDAPEE